MFGKATRKNPARRPFSSGNPQCSVFGNSCHRGGALYRDVLLRLRFDDDEQFQQEATEVAEALTAINVWQLRTYDLPCCPSCAGVEYVPPQRCNKRRRRRTRKNPGYPFGGRGLLSDDCSVNDVRRSEYDNCQLVLDARGLYEVGRGTCFELACERAARLRCAGEDARVVIEQEYEAGKMMLGQYHAYVLVYQGGTPVREEDPAEELQGLRDGECMCPDCPRADPGGARLNPEAIGTRQHRRQHENPSSGAIETTFRRGYDDATRGAYSPGTQVLQNEALVDAYDAGFEAGELEGGRDAVPASGDAAGGEFDRGYEDGLGGEYDPGDTPLADVYEEGFATGRLHAQQQHEAQQLNPAISMPGPRGDEELTRGFQDGLRGQYQPGGTTQPRVYEQGFASGRLYADKQARGEAA